MPESNSLYVNTYMGNKVDSDSMGCHRISRGSKGFYSVLRPCFEDAKGGANGCRGYA